MTDLQKAISDLTKLSNFIQSRVADADDAYGFVAINLRYWQTIKDVISMLKSQVSCEDAVSRKYLLDQSYSLRFQTIDESDDEAHIEKVVSVDDIENAPSVQSAPVARLTREIKVLIDDGGIFQGLYVSPELSDCKVELLDFVTDDPDEIEDVEHRYQLCVDRAKKGELVCID